MTTGIVGEMHLRVLPDVHPVVTVIFSILAMLVSNLFL